MIRDREKYEKSRRIDNLIWMFEHQDKNLTGKEKLKKMFESKFLEITDEEKEILKEKLKF